MKRLPILILLVVLITGCSKAEPEADTPQQKRSPQDVIRAFFIAMLSNDEAGVRKEILPNPDAEILWQGEAPPLEALPQIKAQFSSMTCQECRVGETIDLPGGRKLKVTDQMVNKSSKLLFTVIDGQTMPTPLAVTMVDGEWKVDAGPLIAARLAAKRIREVREKETPTNE